MPRKRKDTIKSINLAVDNWARGSEVSANKKIALVSSAKRKEWEEGKKVTTEKVEGGIRLYKLHYSN
jgi:hypothetical protein